MKKQSKENKSTKLKETDNSQSLIKRTDIKDSPFIIVTTQGISFGAMGKYKITEDYKTEKEVKQELEKITWNRIAQVILLINETTKENEN